jgi:hypothetical protein
MGDNSSAPQNVASFSPSRKAIVLGASLIIAIGAGAFYLFGISGCSGTAADGYASANVQTWHDSDGDGEKDAGESLLPWVTIQLAYESSITDSNGQGTVGVFKPGCVSRCWKDEAVSVKVPPGYKATTPTEIDLTGQDDTYIFGFQLEEGAQPSSFPNEPDWFQAFPNRGLDLMAFHYATDDKRLAVSFKGMGSSDEDALYRNVFDVVRTLKKIEGISVEWLEITIPPDNVAVCEMSKVEEWVGKISPSEIVSTYCQRSQSPHQ